MTVFSTKVKILAFPLNKRDAIEQKLGDFFTNARGKYKIQKFEVNTFTMKTGEPGIVYTIVYSD